MYEISAIDRLIERKKSRHNNDFQVLNWFRVNICSREPQDTVHMMALIIARTILHYPQHLKILKSTLLPASLGKSTESIHSIQSY